MKTDERLNNVKVYVDGKSHEIQNKAFELGYVGLYGVKRPKRTDDPFLYFCDGKIQYGRSMAEFVNSNFQEMTANCILEIDVLGKQPKLVPFQKVLVRESDIDIWRCEFFSHIEEDTNTIITTSGTRTESERKYACILSDYEQCIPYEGNERLLGTDDNPWE